MARPGLKINGIYDHPEDGHVRVIGGTWLSEGRISNFWDWEVLATGEQKSGYGAPWPDVSDQYEIVVVPKGEGTKVCVCDEYKTPHTHGEG